MEPLGLRFLNLNSITTSLGQLFGLIGMTLFSINLILAGRFKFLDKYFKGLDKVYINHHKLGAISFSLLLFHPLFLVVKYFAISIREASLFFVPFVDMPITLGIISLLLMIVLLGLTFYSKLKYHNWKISHKFMIVVFIFAILHTLIISSDIARNDFLRYYVLILALVGLATSFHQAFLGKFLIKKLKYKIINVSKLNKDIVEIEMEPLNKKMVFNSGQFAFFSFLSERISIESHPFSISSSDKENNLKITAKNLGDYTGELKDLKSGDNVLIDGPYGNFSYKKVESKNQIWVAGGIGVTPFLGMAKTLENDYKIDLYYSVKENKEAIHMGDLREIEQKNSNFKCNLWISSEKGYITASTILNSSNGLDDKDIFLCGPSLFMESLKNQFVSLGVDIRKIHYENFSF